MQQRSVIRPVHNGTGLASPPVLDLIPDVLRIAASEVPPAARASAVRHYLGGRADLITPAAVAGLIGAALASGAVTVTALLTALTGTEVILHPIGPHMRPADAGEAAALKIPPKTQIYVREGRLMAGTVICADVSLKTDPVRLCQLASGAAWAAIRAGTSAGTALAPYGLAPGYRRTEVIPDGNPAVKARRVLAIKGSPVGIATEAIPEAFCQLLAARAR